VFSKRDFNEPKNSRLNPTPNPLKHFLYWAYKFNFPEAMGTHLNFAHFQFLKENYFKLVFVSTFLYETIKAGLK
jgi:hypothetical protein